ncbi:MAG: hypothetical protein JO102_07475, partial [Elusimicrobia bacterium]|nr:hypothetical protein [Elusimicrobiota bacterium]
RQKVDVALVTAESGGGFEGFRANFRKWAPREKDAPRVEVPFRLGSADGRFSEEVGQLTELLSSDAGVTSRRFRAFVSAAKTLLPGDARQTWLMWQALGGQPMTLDEAVEALTSDAGEAAFRLRQRWAAVLQPITVAPGGAEEIAAHNSLAALVGGRIDIALKIALLLASREPKHYFSIDRLTGVYTPIDPADLSSEYRQPMDELNHEIGVYALPLGSEITLPAGTRLTIAKPGNVRETVTFDQPTSAVMVDKFGKFVSIVVEIDGQPRRTSINMKRVRLPDVDETGNLEEPEPPADGGAAIPLLAAAFAWTGAAVAVIATLGRLTAERRTQIRSSLNTVYRRYVAWIVEAPLAPGLGGWLIALALGAHLPPTASWVLGQAAAAILFTAFHYTWKKPLNARAALIAAFGFLISLFAPSGGLGAMIGVTIAVATVHLLANNADQAQPKETSLDRRAFLEGVGRLAVQVAGAGPLARLAAMAGEAPLPSAAGAASVAVDASGAVMSSLEPELAAELASELLRRNIGTISPTIRARILAEEMKVLARMSPERLRVVRQLAALLNTARVRGMSADAVVRETRRIIRGLATPAANAEPARSAAPAAPEANAVPVGRVVDRVSEHASNPFKADAPAAAETRAPDFFDLVGREGATDEVVAAVLGMRLGRMNEAHREQLTEVDQVLGALSPERRRLVEDLARLWIRGDEESLPEAQLLEEAERIITRYRSQLRLALGPYIDADPMRLPEHGHPRWEVIAEQFSDRTSPAFLAPSDLDMVKALARDAGVNDETVARALAEAHQAGLRDILLDIHPYARRARTELDEFFSVYRLHEGAYHVLRELRRAGELPADAVLINVDPHSDLFRADHDDTPVVAGSWIGSALRDGLISTYIQMRHSDAGSTYLLWTYTPGAENPITSRALTAEEAQAEVNGRPIFLSLDADAFRLRPGPGNPGRST